MSFPNSSNEMKWVNKYSSLKIRCKTFFAAFVLFTICLNFNEALTSNKETRKINTNNNKCYLTYNIQFI